MSSSGTYSFLPTNGQCVIQAYRRCQIRTPELRQEHWDAAFMEMNLALVKFGNLQPNLWEVSLTNLPLVQGQGAYTLPANTVMILDAYITTNSGSQQSNRYMTPFSRTDFASLADPTNQGAPTQFWFDRIVPPVLNLWPVPDGNGPYTLGYYSVSQMQDSKFPNGGTPDLAYRFLDAFISEIAYRLACIYAPTLEAQRAAAAEKAWEIAAQQDTEWVGLSLSPPIGRYYPR